jgi:hypothetical protein
MARKWKHQVLKRKNFAPSFIITLGLWVFLIILLFGADPMTWGVLPLFFILFFVAVFFLSAILLAHSRRGLFIAIALTLFLFLLFIGTGTFVNLLLVILIFVLLPPLDIVPFVVV